MLMKLIMPYISLKESFVWNFRHAKIRFGVSKISDKTQKFLNYGNLYWGQFLSGHSILQWISQFLLAALRTAQRAGILVRPIFRFFAPQRRCVTPIGVKFGTEEGTTGPLLRAKFHTIDAAVRVWDPAKTEIFTEIWSKCGI